MTVYGFNQKRVLRDVETFADLSAEERAELLSRLTDEQARAVLSEYLTASAGPTADAADSATRTLMIR